MSTGFYVDLLKQLEDRQETVMVTVLTDKITKMIYCQGERADIDQLVSEVWQEGRPILRETEQEIIVAEPFCPEERMILLGGGHVSLALAEFSAKTGFAVTVADDRPFFANKTRFPWARKVVCQEFSQAIKELNINPTDYVVILTRGHRYDGMCLRTLYEQPQSAYLGMIGSRRRVKSLKEQLIEEGIDSAWLERIYSPVGLDIGAVTPEEIAVAILAEIIEVKRKGPKKGEGSRSLQSDIDMRVMDKLARCPEKFADMGKAVVTILETKGSVPRKAGAKMIVYENGMIEGTIGGGCAESGIMGKARQLIGTGKYEICHVDMTGTIAEEEGMVCGGTMKVLLEDGIF